MKTVNLDTKIVIQAVTRTQDVNGGLIESWSMLAAVWAQVQPLTGSEAIRAGVQKTSNRISKFTIRWRDDVSVNNRISYGGEYWNIVFVAEVGRQAYLELSAEVTE